MGIVTALLFARKGLPLTVLLGYLASASLPLTFALWATLRHGHDADGSYVVGALVGPGLGFLVAWSLRKIRGNRTRGLDLFRERRPSPKLEEDIRG
jgi:hypothetical protein